MISTLILVLMYLAFISLGLPDPLLGVAWPAIQIEWALPLDAAGIVAFITSINTIISSFMSGRVIRRFGTEKVVFISCVMTGGALLGISFAPSFIWLILLAIPLGLGAGSVDTALNNYVSLHYKSSHMNWLHSFWGVGATIGPIIMGQALLLSNWKNGYRYIGFIQLTLALIFFISLPLWKLHTNIVGGKNLESKSEDITQITNHSLILKPYHTKGLIFAVATFLFYCAVEVSIGLWGSSYLVQAKGIIVEYAAAWIAMYYGGITIGRFISGFIALKFSNNQMIRGGCLIALMGTVLATLPIPDFLLMGAFVLIGLGLSPIYPSMIHETPHRFGSKHSETLIGYQMAFANIGATVFPPLLGIAIKNISIHIFPYFLVICIALMFICTERLRAIYN